MVVWEMELDVLKRVTAHIDPGNRSHKICRRVQPGGFRFERGSVPCSFARGRTGHGFEVEQFRSRVEPGRHLKTLIGQPDEFFHVAVENVGLKLAAGGSMDELDVILLVAKDYCRAAIRWSVSVSVVRMAVRLVRFTAAE